MTKIKLNRRGMRDLLRDPAVKASLEAEARKIATRAGSGHVSKSDTTAARARAVVTAETRDAKVKEATDRNLTRAAQ